MPAGYFALTLRFATNTLSREAGSIDPFCLCRIADSLGRGIAAVGVAVDVGVVDPRSGGRGGCSRGHLRPRSATALGAAELSDPWAYAFPAGGAAAGDTAVLHRAELRWTPLRPRRSIVDLRTGQRHCRRAGFRHRTRYRSGRLRVSGAHGTAGRAARRAVPGAGRW